MMRAWVVVDTKAISRSGAELVHGGLWLRFNDTTFPEAGWTDFIVVVLSWWVAATRRLVCAETTREEMRFMDGPYLAEVLRTQPGTWEVRCIESRAQGPFCRHEVSIEAGSLVESLLEACDAVLDACRQREWWSADADALGSGVALLRAANKDVMS